MRVRFLISGLLFAGAVIAPCIAGAQSAPKKEAASSQQAPAAKDPHDLSGVWNMRPTPEARKYIGNTFSAEPPALTAWGQQQSDATKPSNGPHTHSLEETDDPVIKGCFPPGTPRIYLQPFPMQIVQTPTQTIMIYEYDHTVRYIQTNLKAHAEDLTPTYMGNSIGRWDGDTFVVDTTAFNDKTWLDRTGHRHSDQLHVIERFRRVDANNLQIDLTMEDPKALAKPWTSQLTYQLKPDWTIGELVCADNAGFLGFEK